MARRLTLLLPATARLAQMSLPPALAAALGRADRQRLEPGEQAQLARHFDLLPRGWPAAALTRLLDAGEATTRGHLWLRADPAHLRADINGARLLGVGAQLGLDSSDAQALLPVLQPVFEEAGYVLDAPHPARWYLRLPRGTPLPAFSSPDDALGDDVFEHAAQGSEARRWRALESEVQILLHQHPHNAARVAAGRPAINALWFWGGGELPDTVSSRVPMIYSDDPAVLGAARLGKLQSMHVQAYRQDVEHALVDLRAQRDARALVHDWLLPTLACERAIFDFADGLYVDLRPGQRWRWWRRPLADLSA